MTRLITFMVLAWSLTVLERCRVEFFIANEDTNFAGCRAFTNAANQPGKQ
jgi:hypothetical protein